MSDEANLSAQFSRPGSKAPSERLRKHIPDPSSSSSDTESASSYSVEYPVEGKHTDTEDDFDGNSAPIFIQSVPAPVVQAQPTGVVQLSYDNSTIPRKSKKSKKNKKSKKSSTKSQR